MTEFIRLKLTRPQKDMFDTDEVIVNKDYISVFVPSNGAILIAGLGFCYVDPEQRREIEELLGIVLDGAGRPATKWLNDKFEDLHANDIEAKDYNIPPDPAEIAKGRPVIAEDVPPAAEGAGRINISFEDFHADDMVKDSNE